MLVGLKFLQIEPIRDKLQALRVSPASAVQPPHCQSPYGFEPSRLGGRRIKRPKTVRLIPIKSRQSGLVGKVLKLPKWSCRQILTFTAALHRSRPRPARFPRDPKALTKTHTCKHTRDHCMFYEPLNKLLLHRGYTGIRYLGS